MPYSATDHIGPAEVRSLFYWVVKTVVRGPLLSLLYLPWVGGWSTLPAAGAAGLAVKPLLFSAPKTENGAQNENRNGQVC